MTEDTRKSGWEHFPHQADIGIRGLGITMEEAFEQAAVALTAVITDPGKVQPEQRIDISCSDSDNELLFVDWLNCLLYEMATRKMLFSWFEVCIEQDSPGPAKLLKASAWGQKIDVAKHRPTVEVKAATYTLLSVRRQEDGAWAAQCVVDV
jgi:SHS2 domain-containing protein